MKTKVLFGTAAVLALLAVNAWAQVTVTTVNTNGLHEPYDVVVDADSNMYLSDSVNNRIVRIDANTGAGTTLAGLPGDPPGSDDGPAYLAHFNSPQSLAFATIGGTNGLVVSDSRNHTIRFVRLSDGYVTTLAGAAGVAGSAANTTGANARFRTPLGLTVDNGGNLYIADSLNNVIRVINLADPLFSVTTVVVSGTTFRQPTALSVGFTNDLWVADTGNHSVKRITLSSAAAGAMTTFMGSNDRTISGATDSQYGPNARFNGPRGLLWLGAAGLLISDTANNTIRLATNYTAFGATNYAISTYAGIPGQAGLVDAAALSAKFNAPIGMGRDVLGSGFLVADMANNAIRRIQNGTPQPPVANPAIGWVDFEQNNFATFVTVLRTDQPFVFNNDQYIAFFTEAATETFFTFGPTPPSPLEDTIPTPNRTTGISAPSSYRDGIPYYSDFLVTPLLYAISIQQPDFTIKAIGMQDGRRASSVVQARFQFKTANPIITGENAASFQVWDLTDGAVMWYTTDGVTDPLPNGTNSTGPITGTASIPKIISLDASTSNLTFKIRAFRNNYKDSEIVTKVFSSSNFIPNRITFGLTNGEPSSTFLARPGQFFYAPVTLKLQAGGEVMYSLQFNVAVTNGPVNPGTGLRPPNVQNGAGIDFFSMLMSQVPPIRGDHLPPNSPQWYLGIPQYLMTGITNEIGYAQFVNTNNNVLGVGWLYRQGYEYIVRDLVSGTYLLDFDTTKHDLINFSIAHDTLFNKENSVVVAGAYSFQVPPNASVGDQYFIQLGSPSATRDGIGEPGSDVYIQPPPASQLVRVGTPSYVAGDAAPFHWLNAGDFGQGYLDNADVMQVFQSAVLLNDMPPANSDLFRAMDSCGSLGIFDGANGYYVNAGPMTPAQFQAMFDGSDPTINCVAFGDTYLDVSDVFVTLRRSLDPSLAWFRRFWTNGQFVAVTTSNLAFNTLLPTNNPAQCNLAAASSQPSPSFAYEQSSVSFKAGDAIVSAGQTIQIPITVLTSGNYPLRVLGLNLTVRPLEGSPELTQPVQFAVSSGLGQPTIAASKHAANFSGAWLDSHVPGLGGSATLGTLTITIPANATAASAYGIHFDHASASPNGIASFSRQTRSGLLTLSDRSASSWNDGIPDSWRLRYFGTLNNLLSAATADADGDGANNLQEFRAGTDPNDRGSNLRVKAAQNYKVRWPTAADKSYVIERAPTLQGPWSTLATRAGTGFDVEYQDTASGPPVRFYRVRIADAQ